MERAAALLSNRGEQNGIEEIHLRALRALVEQLEKRRYWAPKNDSKQPRKPDGRPSRHIPARIRRTVFERDGARCTHIDIAGQRCRETHHLELHHLVPFARGGEHTAANLDLRCSAHNALAAELAVPARMQQNLLGVTFSCALPRLQAHPPQRARLRYPRELARPDTHRAR
jgi:hypothetical protein